MRQDRTGAAMKAFASVRAEMRHAASTVTHPSHGEPDTPIRIACAGQGDADDDGPSYIEPWMAAAFRAVTHASETDEPFALLSCFMNGKPAVIIAGMHQQGGSTHVLPLFMAVQQGMRFSEHAPEDDEPEPE